MVEALPRMTQLRFLSYFSTRIPQLLGWSVDTNSLVDPLLKREEIAYVRQQIHESLLKLQPKVYQPPLYVPPKLPEKSG